MKEVQKQEILDRLKTRLDLKSLPGQAVYSKLALADIILGVVELDSVLREPGHLSGSTGELSAAHNTWTTIYTVPSDERNDIIAIQITRPIGDNTISQVRFFDSSNSGEYSQVEFGAAASHYKEMILPIELDRGDQIKILTNGAGSAASTFVIYAWGVVRKYH